jgi:hypothetical protein
MRIIYVLMIMLAALAPIAAVPANPPNDVADRPPPFLAVNVLEEQLMEAAVAPEKRGEFLRSLLASDVYLATPDAPESESSRVIPAGEKLKILSAKLADGKDLPALFTSKRRISDYFGPDKGYLQMSGRQALELVGSNGIVLNPGSAYGVVLSDKDVAAVLGKPVARTLDKATKIQLGTPAKRPDQLIARLEAIFAQDPRIKEVWLSLAVWTESGETVWYLQIVTDAPHEDIVDLLSKIGGAMDLGGYPLDSLIVEPSQVTRTGYRIKP